MALASFQLYLPISFVSDIIVIFRNVLDKNGVFYLNVL